MKMSWEYIAGFFDGEGSISGITRASNACWGVSISQSNFSGSGVAPPILLEISAFLTLRGINHTVCPNKDKDKKAHHRDNFSLQIFNRAGMSAFIRGTLPFLRVKKQVAEDLVRFLKIYPSLQGHLAGRRRADISEIEIRADFAAGMTWAAVMAKHKVSASTIQVTLNRERSREYARNYRAKRKAASAA